MELPSRPQAVSFSATHPPCYPPALIVPASSQRNAGRDWRPHRSTRTLSRPSTARGRFSRTLKAHRSCQELHVVSAEFSKLSSLTRNFLTANSVEALKSDLPGLFQTLTRYFDGFCNRGTIAFSNASRQPLVKSRPQRTPLYSCGFALASTWSSFIVAVSDVGEADIVPYQATVSQNFRVFSDSIDRVVTTVKYVPGGFARASAQAGSNGRAPLPGHGSCPCPVSRWR